MAKKAYIGVDGIARKIKKGYVGVENFAKVSLPSGYTQLECIESTGTQYIDTGFIPNGESRITMDCALTSTSSNACFFCARSEVSGTASDTNSLFFISNNSNYRFDYYGSSASTSGYASAGTRIIVDNNKGALQVGSYSLSMASSTNSSPMSWMLMASSTSSYSSITNYASMKLYSCKIYDNGTLARDYIPCKNDSGAVGLYDVVNGKFYENAGTGAFTSGAEHGSFARKIKKAYVGVGGVARPFWSGGELTYYGTATALSSARRALAATTVGDYALFGGGYESSYSSAVDAYNSSLTRSTPTALSRARNSLAATTVESYALFGGGTTSSSTTIVDAYNSSLTRSTPTALSRARNSLAATTVGDYALFGSGYDNGSYYSAVDAYNSSLTRSTPTALSIARYYIAATTVGDYALFGGGLASGSRSTVDAYDISLTRSTPTVLSTARYLLAATTVGNYALFGGGYGGTISNTVDAYDISLTRSTPTALSIARYYIAATTVGNYALFGGGYTGNNSNIVDAYDISLTRSTPTVLSNSRYNLAATTVGSYALFGGGYTGNNSNTVDVYTVA